jgi:hypothetical protein
LLSGAHFNQASTAGVSAEIIWSKLSKEEAADLGVEAVLRLKDDVLVEVGKFPSGYPMIVKYE